MRRMITLLAVALFALATLAGPVAAEEEPPPEHGHVLLLGADFELNPEFDPDDPATGGPFIIHGFRKCVEVANAQAVPLHAHHHGLHQGRAGHALRTKAGHLPVPLAPYGPPFLTSCDQAQLLIQP